LAPDYTLMTTVGFAFFCLTITYIKRYNNIYIKPECMELKCHNVNAHAGMRTDTDTNYRFAADSACTNNTCTHNTRLEIAEPGAPFSVDERKT